MEYFESRLLAESCTNESIIFVDYTEKRTENYTNKHRRLVTRVFVKLYLNSEPAVCSSQVHFSDWTLNTAGKQNKTIAADHLKYSKSRVNVVESQGFFFCQMEHVTHHKVRRKEPLRKMETCFLFVVWQKVKEILQFEVTEKAVVEELLHLNEWSTELSYWLSYFIRTTYDFYRASVGTGLPPIKIFLEDTEPLLWHRPVTEMWCWPQQLDFCF